MAKNKKINLSKVPSAFYCCNLVDDQLYVMDGNVILKNGPLSSDATEGGTAIFFISLTRGINNDYFEIKIVILASIVFNIWTLFSMGVYPYPSDVPGGGRGIFFISLARGIWQDVVIRATE